ncbi:AFG1/ZapE family ATPase, partial [Rhizobium ruizarguesonis]
RGLFLPFVALLKQHVDVVSLDSPTYYRMENLSSQPVYLVPINEHNDMAMDASWTQALQQQFLRHGRCGNVKPHGMIVERIDHNDEPFDLV